jgi:protein-L-isoaspartate(D-aspartate) O-methyltransferase
VAQAQSRLVADIADWLDDPRGPLAAWLPGGLDARVRAALLAVPRDRFVRPCDVDAAYRDTPLPIGHGQTISQPLIVAAMTALLDTAPDQRVLEVGTGSGYQAAVLSRLVAHIHSVETVPALADSARAALASAGCANVAVHDGDGALGWPDGAPYDRIIVTCAARRVPPALVEKLRPGGRLVIPLDTPEAAVGAQCLAVIDKDAAGAVRRRDVLPVAFVPLVTQEDV